MSSEISHPFRVTPTGGIAITSSLDERIRQHVLTVLATRPTERVMFPTFGTPLDDVVFEEEDPDVLDILAQDIRDSLHTWVPEIRVLSIVPVLGQSGDGTMGLDVHYTHTTSPLVGSGPTAVQTATVLPGGKVKETS
jgi:phage baseplate assembly protein W